MTLPQKANLYGVAVGTSPTTPAIPFAAAPGPTNVNYPLFTIGVVESTNSAYMLTSITPSNGQLSATWTLLGAGSGDLNTLTTQDSTVVTPTSGNINISGTSPLSTTGSGSTVTIALGTVPVADGGTGATTLTGVLTGNGTSAVTANAITQHGVLVGGASNAVSSLAVAATGTVLAGSTGANPAFTASPSVTGSVTAGTTLTATLGAITATNGNLVLGTAGNKILSTSVATTTTAGANSFGSVTLVSGTATVATTAVTANSLIVLWRQSIGSTGAAAIGELVVGTITASTSFIINSVSQTSATSNVTTDVSVVGWMIIN